jgi:hypothetical protein
MYCVEERLCRRKAPVLYLGDEFSRMATHLGRAFRLAANVAIWPSRQEPSRVLDAAVEEEKQVRDNPSSRTAQFRSSLQ